MKKKLLIVFISLITFAEVSAQCATCPPPPGGIGFDDNVNDEVPINGLLALGILAGAFYGIKKLK